MNRKLVWILVFSLGLAAVAHGQTAATGLAASSVVDCGRGLVAVNLSTISAVDFAPATQASGNSTDLFCDPNSMITGSTNISNASSVQCANFLPSDNVPVP